MTEIFCFENAFNQLAQWHRQARQSPESAMSKRYQWITVWSKNCVTQNVLNSHRGCWTRSLSDNLVQLQEAVNAWWQPYILLFQFWLEWGETYNAACIVSIVLYGCFYLTIYEHKLEHTVELLWSVLLISAIICGTLLQVCPMHSGSLLFLFSSILNRFHLPFRWPAHEAFKCQLPFSPRI